MLKMSCFRKKNKLKNKEWINKWMNEWTRKINLLLENKKSVDTFNTGVLDISSDDGSA